jgi:hypothetical protein
MAILTLIGILALLTAAATFATAFIKWRIAAAEARREKQVGQQKRPEQ